MKAAIYCRVSTEDQEKEGTSLGSQLAACLEKAKELGYEVPDQLIFKETFSGLTTDRPLLKQVRHKAKNGELDGLIVFSPDRLSREGETILNLLKEFKSSGVKLICVNHEFDDSLTGKFIAFVFGWASEFEAAQIKERTMRGKRTVANGGRIPQGTGKGLYGYKWDKVNKKRLVIEFEANVVNRVFNMIAEGNTRFAVAKTLNEQSVPTKSVGKWHPLTIDRMITNTAYIGKTYFGKTCNKGNKAVPEDEWISMPEATPAIISQELFEQANRALLMSKELHRGRPQHDYLLTGRIKCGICGGHLVGTCLNHKYRYYHCRNTYPTSTRGRLCNAGYVRADRLENIVWSKVREVIENPEMVLAELQRRANGGYGGQSAKREITKLKKRLSKYDTEEKRLIKLFRHGAIDENVVLDEVNQLKKDREEAQANLDRLMGLKDQTIDLSSVESKLNKFRKKVRANLDSFTIEQKRMALDALEVQVVATPKKIDIMTIVPLEIQLVQREQKAIFK